MTPESSSRNVCRRETSDPSESLPFPVGGVSLLRRQQIPLAVLAGHWYFGGNQATCCHVPVMPWPTSACLSLALDSGKMAATRGWSIVEERKKVLDSAPGEPSSSILSGPSRHSAKLEAYGEGPLKSHKALLKL